MDPNQVDTTMLHAITLSLQDENETLQKKCNRMETIQIAQSTMLSTCHNVLCEVLDQYPDLETSSYNHIQLMSICTEIRKMLSGHDKLMNEPLWPERRVPSPTRERNEVQPLQPVNRAKTMAPETPDSPSDNSDDDIMKQINQLRMR